MPGLRARPGPRRLPEFVYTLPVAVLIITVVAVGMAIAFVQWLSRNPEGIAYAQGTSVDQLHPPAGCQGRGGGCAPQPPTGWTWQRVGPSASLATTFTVDGSHAGELRGTLTLEDTSNCPDARLHWTIRTDGTSPHQAAGDLTPDQRTANLDLNIGQASTLTVTANRTDPHRCTTRLDWRPELD